VAGERWARRPELQQERKQVLEEVVAFFQSFEGEDSRDPLVRREAGKAHAKIATAHMALGEYSRARTALRAAVDLHAGLAAEFPDDPDHVHDQAVAVGLLGHATALAGRNEEALGFYLRAAELAEAALARADRDEYKLTAAEYLGHAAYFFPIDQAKVAEYRRRARALIEPIATKPGAPYAARVLYAGALLIDAAPAAGGLPADETRALVYRVDEMLAALRDEPAPTVRHAELYDLCRADAAYLDGLVGGGWPRLVRANEIIDGVLAAQPRAFHVRYKKLHYLIAEAQMLDRMGPSLVGARDALSRAEYQRRAKAVADQFAALHDRMIADYPQMAWLRPRYAVARSEWLCHRARAGELDRFDALAADLLSAGQEQNGVRYNLACAYAQAARTAPAADRERHAAKAVALLNELIPAKYFEVASRVAHLEKDGDLDPLRKRDDYQQFRGKLPPAPPAKKP
jgi:hypothetical protein